MTPSPDLAILRHLAARTHASAAEIGAACRFTAAEVRARLVSLESRRLVASRSDKGALPPRRVYFVTGEGKRAAGISDARSGLTIDRPSRSDKDQPLQRLTSHDHHGTTDPRGS